MNLFARFWKWLEPPGPEDLGRAHRDALPLRDLIGEGEEGAYTWEDWEEEVSAKYPIRYFLTHTLRVVVWYPIRRTVSDAWYKFVCHVIPSRRYHLLDLRNPGPGIRYTHGWQDMSEVVAYACFVAVRKFVEEEEHRDPASWASPEELAADEGLAAQKRDYDEIMTIYQWWMSGRVDEEREEKRLFEVTRSLTSRSPEHRVAIDEWLEYQRWREAREDEMLHRIIDVRRRLWT